MQQLQPARVDPAAVGEGVVDEQRTAARGRSPSQLACSVLHTRVRYTWLLEPLGMSHPWHIESSPEAVERGPDQILGDRC